MNIKINNTTVQWLMGLTLCLFLNSTMAAKAKTSALQSLQSMPNASLLVAGKPQYTLRHEQPMVPASTLKVLTALLALETWTPEHRFVTDFYVDSQKNLWVKGYGDPYVTSNELDKMVSGLKKAGISEINGIGIDTSYFAPDIEIDGREKTANAYDAPAGSLALNFNTVAVSCVKKQTISAEQDLALTPVITELLKSYRCGNYRVNVGDQAIGQRYFAEALRAKLEQNEIKVGTKLLAGKISPRTKPYYRHENSHTLAEIIKTMLKYSNNFIANQLFLNMGAQASGAPATVEKAQKAVMAKLEAKFGWKNQMLYEGAGLSRNNHLSASQMLQVLKAFAPYKELLKPQGSQILAKTGTLKGVSSYIGYLLKQKEWVPFVIMINQQVYGNFRKQIAEELLYN